MTVPMNEVMMKRFSNATHSHEERLPPTGEENFRLHRWGMQFSVCVDGDTVTGKRWQHAVLVRCIKRDIKLIRWIDRKIKSRPYGSELLFIRSALVDNLHEHMHWLHRDVYAEQEHLWI